MKYLSINSIILSCTVLTPLIAAADEEVCNPLQFNQDCNPNMALSLSLTTTFQTETDDFESYSSPNKVSYTNDGLVLTIDAKYQNPGISSNFYIMFGKVEATLKAAPGRGIVSSLYLQSDALDEIDLEWFGGDPYEVQTNFFSKGNVTTYDRGGYHPVKDPQSEFHTYTIDWTEERLTWYVDSVPVRALLNSSEEGYPQTPMKVFTGIWVGGDPENSQGTISWSGGLADYNNVPFSMVVSKLTIADYSSGSCYRYTDKTGSWASIEAIDGAINGRVSPGDSIEPAFHKVDEFDRRFLPEEIESTIEQPLEQEVKDAKDDNDAKPSKSPITCNCRSRGNNTSKMVVEDIGTSLHFSLGYSWVLFLCGFCFFNFL